MVEGKLLGTFLVLYGGGFFREKRSTRRVRKVATDVSCFVRWRIFDGEEMFSSCRESYWDVSCFIRWRISDIKKLSK